MPTSRHKTIVEIEVDDRQIVGLERSIGRAFSQSLLADFEKSLGRIAQTMEKLGGVGGPGTPHGGGPPVGGGGGSGTGGGGQGALVRELAALRLEMSRSNEHSRREAQRGSSAWSTFRGSLGANMVTQGMNRVGGAAQGAIGGSATSTALNAIPYIGPVLGAAARQAVSLYTEHASQMQAQAGAFGATGIGRHGMGHLVQKGARLYGLQPGQVPGMVQGIGGASGRTGAGLMDLAGPAMNLQNIMGLQAGGAGLIGAAEGSGGNVANIRTVLLEAVSGGVMAGFREGRLNQYFQQLSSFVEQTTSRGIALDPSSANQFFGQISSAGGSFQGAAGARVASSFGQGFSSAQGNSVWHGLRLNLAGLGSGATLQEASERAEDPASGVMQAMIERVRSMAGGDANLGALLMRQMFSSFGSTLSAVQSREIFENGLSENYASAEHGGATLAARHGQSRGVFAAGQHSAGLALQRQHMGAGLSGVAQNIQRLDLKIMSAGLAAITPAVDWMVENIPRLIEAFSEGGVPALAVAIATGGSGPATGLQGNQLSYNESLTEAAEALSERVMRGTATWGNAAGMGGVATAAQNAANTIHSARQVQASQRTLGSQRGFNSSNPANLNASGVPAAPPGAVVPAPVGPQSSLNLHQANQAWVHATHNLSHAIQSAGGSNVTAVS